MAGAWIDGRRAALLATAAFSYVHLAVLVVDAQAVCPPFNCGHFQNVGYPFRRRGDPPECGAPSYELSCSDDGGGRAKAPMIQINTAAYLVTAIDYTNSSFWVVDADLQEPEQSSCPVPRWDQLPYFPYLRYSRYFGTSDFVEGVLLPSGRTSYGRLNDGHQAPGNLLELAPRSDWWASFINCSQPLPGNNTVYSPVACRSTSSSFVYVSIDDGIAKVGALDPSCGYLGITPLADHYEYGKRYSYRDAVAGIKAGFAVMFPLKWERDRDRRKMSIAGCFSDYWSSRWTRAPVSRRDITDRVTDIARAEVQIMYCLLPGIDGAAIAGKTWNTEYYALNAVAYSMVALKWFAVLCKFVLAPLAVLVFLAHKYWRTRITIDAVEKFLMMQQMIGPMRYTYTDILAITSHFRDSLGQGGFGSVFKGLLLDDVHVAVKMLNSTSSCNGDDFISEVSTIGRIHHVNVVRLVGFCSEEIGRALVYEYMPRGSLDRYIFSAEKSFSWDKLNQIALGIARGINYLHQGCDMQILHFDIKPHNILLDNNFIPKVADFGLAKLYPKDNSFVPSNALGGTVGYIAPEMISRAFGVISSKSDVYSFGMLLLEMAGGRRNADPNAPNSSQTYYPSWVYDHLTHQKAGVISIVDDMHELEKKLCIIGLWCIQMKSHDRPTMSEVIEMLEGGADSLEMPSRPFFGDEEHIHNEESKHLTSKLADISEEDISENIDV